MVEQIVLQGSHFKFSAAPTRFYLRRAKIAIGQIAGGPMPAELGQDQIRGRDGLFSYAETGHVPMAGMPSTDTGTKGKVSDAGVCCTAATETACHCFFSGDTFAKPLPVWCNTHNFLEQEVGPGPDYLKTGALCLTLEKPEMKKTLVAIAALAAVGAASAQSSVTLYGRIDASIGSVKTTVGGVTTVDPGIQIRSGGHTGSRWGLRGSEDLGGGLKANFTLEQGFNIDDGEASSTRQFHRQAFVGLSGGFGTLNVGRQYDITDNMYGLYDPMGYSSYSAMAYVFNEGCSTIPTNVNKTGSGDCIGRQNNSVMYTTPSMGGFSVAAMWAPGEDKATVATPAALYGATIAANGTPSAAVAAVPVRSAGRMYGVMANYANGPIAAGLGWQSNKVAGGQTRSDTNFGASYDLGAAKLFLQLEQGRNKNTAGTGKDSGYGIGAVIPMGAASLTAAYAAEKQKTAGAKVSDAKAFTLFGKYDLSKRTYMYAAYRRGESDPVVGLTQKTTQYGLGLVHNF